MICKLNPPPLHLGDIIELDIAHSATIHRFDGEGYIESNNEEYDKIQPAVLDELGVKLRENIVESSPETISLLNLFGRKPTSEYRGWKPTSCKPIVAKHTGGVSCYRTLKK